MDFPAELRYTKEHEWLRHDVESNSAVIGITSFAQGELGDVVFVELEPAGTAVDADAVFGTVEAVKTVSELFSPVRGTVIELNAELESSPELVNEDPYGAGWMIRIELDDPGELDNLMSSEEYAAMVAE